MRPRPTYALSIFTLALAGHASGGSCDPALIYGEADLVPLDLGGGELISADFNNDGIPDIAGTDAATVFVHLGNGDGTLQAGLSYALPGGTIGSLHATDLNGDGQLDLVVLYNVVGFDHDIAVLIGGGDGTFAPQPGIFLGSGSAEDGLTSADFDGDGNMDLAFSLRSPTTGKLFLALGNGDGTLGPPAVIANEDTRDVRAVDLNNDGAPDLVSHTNSGGFARIFINLDDGAATFTSTTKTTAQAFPDLATGDFNGDGFADVAVQGVAGIKVLLNDGAGGLLDPLTYDAASTGGIATADIDGDGVLDLVTKLGDNIAVLPGVGDGTFDPELVFPGVVTSSRRPVLSDFDLDGDVDVLLYTANGVEDFLALFRNQCTLPPIIETHPAALTFVDAGAEVTLSVAVGLGTPPISYQWRKNGAPLTDSGNVSGATTTQLMLSGVTCLDTDEYDVVASNIEGETFSSMALVAVRDPNGGGPTGSCASDTNGDGAVNSTDLNTLLSEFGDDCE